MEPRMSFEFLHGLVDTSVSSRAVVVNYFDSDISNSINTLVYFDWKTTIYMFTENNQYIQH
jgi:hypothetical protein